MIEGSNTILRNFTEVVNHMERDENHVYQFMLNELGTAGSRDGPRARFKGRIPPKRIKKTIVNYVNAYIKCIQCGAPILTSSSRTEPPAEVPTVVQLALSSFDIKQVLLR